MRYFFPLLLAFIMPAIAHALCSTCTYGRENAVKHSVIVKYPSPPGFAHNTLYKSFPLKKIQTAHHIASYPVIVYPEKTVWLHLSNTDVNRIVCTKGKITYVFTSQEKGVVTEIKDNELYVKFKALLNPQTGSVKRIKTPTEFYVRCAGETYSFIARPRAIPTRTVYLESRKDFVKPPENLINKMSLDSAIVEIIRSVFLSDIPLSWRPVSCHHISLTKITHNVHVTIKETHVYDIPGIPLIVRLFSITSDKAVQLNEKFLLDPSLVKNPLAISIVDHLLRPGSPVSAVIIEYKYGVSS